jgi:prophage regulatory protein
MTVRKFYRLPSLCDITGLSESGLYKLIREGKFPKGVKLTSRATGWPSDAIDRWIESRLTNQLVLQRSETEQLAADVSPTVVAGEVSIAKSCQDQKNGRVR